MIRKILIVAVVIFGIVGLSSCGGAKQPKEKTDFGKVDRAYDDFNRGDN